MNLHNLKNNMHHNGKLIVSVVLYLLCQTNMSCKKYVDIKTQSTQLFIETAGDCQSVLNNYSALNVNYPNDGENSCDDYYLNDARYFSSGSISIEDRDIYSWQPFALRSLDQSRWTESYNVVYLSNLVLEVVDKLKGGGTDQATLDDLRGQALFFRSNSFWQIAQLYAKPYNASSSSADPGIPLRLVSDINDKSTRGTLEQTYSRITTDLLESVRLLNTSSGISSRPNKAAAYAMLARVYLSMGDYSNALTNASQALAIKSDLLDYSKVDKTSQTPFTRFNKEVIFHSVMAPAALLNAPGATSPGAKIDDGLYASFDGNDLRKMIFFKENVQTVPLQNPDYPSVIGAPQFITKSLPDGTFRFTGNYEPVTPGALFNGLAVDELYLIRAEAYARQSNKDAAMTDLNTLLITRWAPGTYVIKTATDAGDALNQVLIERRKELVMRGQRWTDGRRLNLSFTRQTKNVTFSGFANAPVRTVTVSNTYNLPAGDLRFTLLIPRDVLTFGNIAQNPR